MATLGDIGVAAAINVLTAFALLLAFALLRIQPINDRVYFAKWYVAEKRSSQSTRGNGVGRFVNLNVWTYLSFLNWMPQALKMSENEIIRHAGLDSAVFLRIYTLGYLHEFLLGIIGVIAKFFFMMFLYMLLCSCYLCSLKIFGPIAVAALLVLLPVNASGGTLFFLQKELVVSNIDKLSISNVRAKSYKFFIHIGLEYVFTLWACFMLYKEYGRIATMRLKFLASQGRLPEQFTVLVTNVPRVSGLSVSDNVESFFRRNHPDHYLCHQAVYYAKKFAKLVSKKNSLQNWLDYNQLKFERNPEKRPTRKRGFLGLWGKRVDTIDFYREQINDLDKKLIMEREKAMKDPKSVSPAAFVSFNSRWGAAVCAQTQQSKNNTAWLTNWAPEPRDVYWKNLGIPFVSITIRKLVILLAMFALVFFYIIPVTFVQSLANLEGLEKVAPFLRPVVDRKFIKSFLQGFFPGLALKIFLLVLPKILMFMSKVEGHVALSMLERRAAAKYYYFMLVNVFLVSVVAGTAFQQLQAFLHQPPARIPRNIGVSIPMKATFFITYIMLDGWAGIASEILRLKPLVLFHLKNLFLVKTERDLEKAMNPQGIHFPETLPTLQLYFLLGVVYMVVTPILLPFILIFFAFAYIVYRHQVINVYNQKYESAAAFWPHVHSRIIASLLISQLLLLGLLSTKRAESSTPILLVLPILTLTFHKYCKKRFEPAFRKYPLEEAMTKDLEDRASESDPNFISSLSEAYLHPIFHSSKDADLAEVRVDKNQAGDAFHLQEDHAQVIVKDRVKVSHTISRCEITPYDDDIELHLEV